MVRNDVAERNRELKSKYNDPKWIGSRYFDLTVIGITESSHGWAWRCRCVCGKETVVSPYKLLHGKTKTCGCGKTVRAKSMTEKYRVKHGGRHERLYRIWHGMKQRCYCQTHKDYPRWGGRGIGICDEWRDDFSAFRAWSLANGYADELSIDRIDNDGNYTPDNCRWVTMKVQANNRGHRRKNENIDAINQ